MKAVLVTISCCLCGSTLVILPFCYCVYSVLLVTRDIFPFLFHLAMVLFDFCQDIRPVFPSCSTLSLPCMRIPRLEFKKAAVFLENMSAAGVDMAFLALCISITADMCMLTQRRQVQVVPDCSVRISAPSYVGTSHVLTSCIYFCFFCLSISLFYLTPRLLELYYDYARIQYLSHYCFPNFLASLLPVPSSLQCRESWCNNPTWLLSREDKQWALMTK